MKRILVIIAIALGIFMFTAPDAWARGRMHGDVAGCHGADCYDYRGSGCRGGDCAGVRTYSPVALETINGEVIEVYQATSRQGYNSHYALQFVVGNKYVAECTFFPRAPTRKKCSKRNTIL